MYARKNLPQETIIKDVFQTKKDNNVIFNMRTQIKTRLKKRIKSTQEFQGKTIIPIQSSLNNNDRLKMLDDNISSSNNIPGKSFWSINFDVISNTVPSLLVVVVHDCLLNSPFAVELLQNNDSFLNIVNNRSVTN